MSRSGPVRLLSIGSVTPEWGGANRGGVATYHTLLLSELRSRPGDVEIVGVVVSDTPARAAPVPVYVPPRGQPRREFLEAVLRESSPDVVVQHHFATHNGLLLPEVAPGLPRVGVAHSWHLMTFGPPDQRQSARAATEQTISGLQAIVFPSEHCRREGLGLGLEYPPVQRVVHPAIDTIFRSAVEVGRPRDGVTFLGTLEPRKQPEAVVAALARISDLPLSMLGSGPLEADIRSCADRLQLGQRLSLTAPSPAELVEALSSAEVMCLPSLSETFGIAYIEALACGTPVVGFAPTVSEISHALGMAIGEGLKDGSAADIAAAIERVRSASWDRAKLRRRTLEVFSADRIVGQYVDLLRTIVS